MFKSIWYDNLIKPFLQPPAWVFGAVWIFFYTALLISVILYSVTITKKDKKSGFIYFIIHMIFNLLWSPVFFQLNQIKIAFFIIIVVLISAILMVVKFFSVSKLAGRILIPYLIWLMFATYLNFQFMVLN